jgi:hypothetical protein
MTEPIPALIYHQPTLGRRPLFVAVAILAIVFGLLAAFFAGALAIQYLRIIPSNPTMRYSLIPTIVTQGFYAPAYLCLAIAGVAFLLKKRFATLMLCIYIGISLVGIFAGAIVASFMNPGGGIAFSAAAMAGRFVPSMAHAVFDVIVLLLLLNRSVQAILLQASGIEATLLADGITP